MAGVNIPKGRMNAAIWAENHQGSDEQAEFLIDLHKFESHVEDTQDRYDDPNNTSVGQQVLQALSS